MGRGGGLHRRGVWSCCICFTCDKGRGSRPFSTPDAVRQGPRRVREGHVHGLPLGGVCTASPHPCASGTPSRRTPSGKSQGLLAMLLLRVAPEERPPVRVRIRHDAQYTVDLSSGPVPSHASCTPPPGRPSMRLPASCGIADGGMRWGGGASARKRPPCGVHPGPWNRLSVRCSLAIR